MKISITQTETNSFELIIKRNDGKFARVPMTKDEVENLRKEINSFIPPMTVPPIIRVGIEKLYQMTHKNENKDESETSK